MGRKKYSHFNTERVEAGSYVAITHNLIRSHAFTNLSAHAVKLLMDLLSKYNGSNNGDLSAPFSTMHEERGWKSKGTLDRAIKELRIAGFIEISRQGGRHLCSLFALTFYPVDECNGIHDIKATTKPKSLWRKNEPVLDIAKLQKQKLERDEANLVTTIFDIAKRRGSLN